MVIGKSVKILFILVLFLGGFVFNREKPLDENKQLREEILAAYQAGEEQTLLDFVKKKKNKISHEFIKDFAKAGKKKKRKM